MAEGKKSFVAYCDWGDIFDELSNEEAGKLVKHLFNYVRDKNPVTDDKLTKMLFIQIQQSLKRDLVKYDKYIDKQRVNGSKGGRPKNPTLSEKTQPFIEKPKKADSVNVNVSVNDILERKKVFRQSIKDFIKDNPDKYPKQLYIDFEEYWTEHGDKDKKMRYEKEKTFGLSRRLSSWSKNGFNDYTTKSNPSINSQPVN